MTSISGIKEISAKSNNTYMLTEGGYVEGVGYNYYTEFSPAEICFASDTYLFDVFFVYTAVVLSVELPKKEGLRRKSTRNVCNRKK